MRVSPASTALASLLLLGSACDRVPAEAVTRCETRSVRGAAKTDILFVIDDSLSMAEEQQNVRDNLAGFLQRLVDAPVRNDFQIGVTNTSIEDFDASLASYPAGTPSEGLPYPAGALVAVERGAEGRFQYDAALAATNPLAGFVGPRILRAGSESLLADFAANVLVGTGGTGKEQALRAARLALTDRLADGVNAGFLRPGARLAIVFVSDEDDCSDGAGVVPSDGSGPAFCLSTAGKDAIDPVADFAAFLRGPLDGELRDVVVGVIAGVDFQSPPSPSCGRSHCANQTCATAYDEAERFSALVGELGGVRTRLDSICDASFADSLASIAELLVSQTMALEGAPADWRMLAVAVDRVDGSRLFCDVAAEGDAAAASADAVYTPPLAGRPATLTFQNDCVLTQGDAVDLKLVCAG
jgi:hypothetical protein